MPRIAQISSPIRNTVLLEIFPASVEQVPAEEDRQRADEDDGEGLEEGGFHGGEWAGADERGILWNFYHSFSNNGKWNATAYGPTLPSSTRVVSTPVAMSILKIVPAPFAPPLYVVPRKAPWPSLTKGALGPYPL